MPKSIFVSLHYGEIKPQETAVAHNPEQKELDRKIESEKRYFVEKMSLDDNQRFEALERLYMQAAESEKIALFSEGFKLCTRIMLEILSGQDDGTYD